MRLLAPSRAHNCHRRARGGLAAAERAPCCSRPASSMVDRLGARRRAPCRGGRASRRRAVRHAGAGARHHGDRGRPDRVVDAGRRLRPVGARTRYHLCNRDDHRFRCRRHLRAAGRTCAIASRYFASKAPAPRSQRLVTLATLVLILPVFTISAPGSGYSGSQLLFMAISSLALWLVFVFFQTVRHRDYFLPAARTGPTKRCMRRRRLPVMRIVSLLLLMVSLVAVVGLAKVLSPALESPCLRPPARRAQCRHSDRPGRPAAGDRLGHPGGARESTADQHEPRARVPRSPASASPYQSL